MGKCGKWWKIATPRLNKPRTPKALHMCFGSESVSCRKLFFWQPHWVKMSCQWEKTQLISQAFRNSKFQFQSWKLYSYRPSYQTKRTVPHRVPNVLSWSMVKNLLETSKVMIISYFFSGNGILNKKSKAKLLISRPGQGAELLDVQSLTKGEEK